MRATPKYAVGDYLIIYCGQQEGCCFTVRAVEWRHQYWSGGWSWHYDTGSYGWRAEDTISTEGHFRLFA